MKKKATPLVVDTAIESEVVSSVEVSTIEVVEVIEIPEVDEEVEEEVEESVKDVVSEGRSSVTKTLKTTTKSHLQVFSKKTIEGSTASRMRPGAELILEFLEATAQNGEQLVRVRKDGSTRTFYTTNTHVQEVIA